MVYKREKARDLYQANDNLRASRNYAPLEEDSEHSCNVECGVSTLDAHNLMAVRALQKRKISWSSTTPPSSLDLEWENEGYVGSVRSGWGGGSTGRLETEGGSSGSRPATSPESLEWDEELSDREAEHLIAEIERLTVTALRETGDCLLTDINLNTTTFI